jgi:hypothetical protein
MRDTDTKKDIDTLVILPNNAKYVDLYFVDNDCQNYFDLYPGRFPKLSYQHPNQVHDVTGVEVDYYLFAYTDWGAYCLQVIHNEYDPIGEVSDIVYYTKSSVADTYLSRVEGEHISEQQSEPNSFRMVLYPIGNNFSKLSSGTPYTYHDAIIVNNPWSLPIAVTVRQPIDTNMTILSVGELGVLQGSEIIWNIELHPHETKILTYDFAVLGAKVPQSGFVIIPPASMTIYDAVRDISETFESGNTRLWVWEKMLGDLNKDDAVNISDLAWFCYHWLEQDCNQPNWCGGADLNYSESVDFLDFAIFAQNWLWTKVPTDIDANGKLDFDDLAIITEQWLELPGYPSADIAPLPDGDNIVDFHDFAMFAQDWLEGTTP